MSVSPVLPMSLNPWRRGCAQLASLGASLAVAVVAAGPASAAAAPPDLLVQPAPAGPPATTAWVSGRDVLVADDPAGVGAGRRVARLTTTGRAAPGVALSRDGRHLAVMGGEGVWSVPIAAGGPPTRLGDVPEDGAGGVRWAPDGRQVLLVNGSITHCVVEPQVRCRKAATNGVAEFGASWSPDSTTFAYTRARRDRGNTGVGDLVTRPVAAGPVRVVARATFGKRRVRFPTSAVWTRSGLAWTTYAGRNVRDFEFRLSTRLRRPDGTVRMLAASPALTGKVLVPFLVSAETPSGNLLGQRIDSPSGTIDDEASVALRTLSASGRQAPYGVKLTAIWRGSDGTFWRRKRAGWLLGGCVPDYRQKSSVQPGRVQLPGGPPRARVSTRRKSATTPTVIANP